MAATTRTTRGRAGRLAAVLVVGALVAAACGDDDDEPASTEAPAETGAPATDPPVTEAPAETAAPATDPAVTDPPVTDPPIPDTITVTSPDGQLTMEVDGSAGEGVDPSISILDPSQWPEEIAGGENLPGVTVYQLEPVGATYSTPVRVTRGIEAAALPSSSASAVPLAVLFTEDDSGFFQPLGDPSVTSIGDVLSISGTTLQNGLIATLSLGSEVQIDGLVPVADPPLIDDADFASVPVVASDAVDAVSDVPPRVVAPGFENREPQPTASPLDVTLVSEIDGDAPAMVYSIATTVEHVPAPSGLFGDPQLDVPDELALQVIFYIAAVEAGDDESASQLAAQADALAQGAGLQWSIGHIDFELYPSFARAEFSGISEYPADANLYLVRYVGPSDGTGRVIDIAPLKRDGANYTADAGLVSFGLVQDAVLTAAGELPAELVDGDPSSFWQFYSAQTDVPIQLFSVIDTATGEVLVHDVGPAEGVEFSGDVGFEPFPIP